ncbi:hypothetical protein P0F23_002839 [Vibrio metschnikovii]|uniref:hypothetical protein n=1 Tax=Vibrio metschnikovii TaxID=28172 RepID=UPI001C2F8196|nr:hypothetical protein [Vibrio metschnikovii]EKO3895391.1 hypothetical protein [Vibrio metschnikovii]
MKVLEKNQIKVLETEKLLRGIITSPAEFKDDAELLEALKSQTGIAKYQDHKRTIEPCSLNTLKSNAETLLERGFLSLNELRLNAKWAIEEALHNERLSKSNKQTVVGLRHKVEELESQLDAAQRSNFLLTVMVSELRSKLKELANHEGTVEERQKKYRDYNKKIEAELNYTLSREV